MAYQKLQGYRAWPVNKSDLTDIPNIGIVGPSGTTTSAATKQLIDSNANFTAGNSSNWYDRSKYYRWYSDNSPEYREYNHVKLD
jgi:hypothetical protein